MDKYINVKDIDLKGIETFSDSQEILIPLSDVRKALQMTPAADVVSKKDYEDLQYTLEGVMHSVDKWLEGDELNQDEVNRAITMREKTLKIIEDLRDSKINIPCKIGDKCWRIVPEYCSNSSIPTTYTLREDKVARILIEEGSVTIELRSYCSYRPYMIGIFLFFDEKSAKEELAKRLEGVK